MAIASCFFCVPTPNASISESNLTRPHLAFSPRLSSSSSSFAGVISAKSISFHRRVPTSSIFSASIDNGGSDDNNNGGGGDGGKNDGDGDGGEDRDRNRNEAMILLAESGTGLDTLPKDLAAAIESGRIPGSVITRFLDLQKSAVMRWLMQFAGFRERLLADDLFFAMECGVGIFTKTAAEYERRRENFFNEREVVFADVEKSTGLVVKEELGRATWTFLHTLAAQYPEKPTRQQKKDVKELMAILSRMYPCRECADHFKEILRSNPAQTGSQEEFSQWLCHVHNTVNRSLGKLVFPCERVDARWGKLECEQKSCDLHGTFMDF